MELCKRLIILISIIFISKVNAGTLNLTDSPLFVSNTVAPNIFFEIDDSGSMDWEIMTPKHWHPCTYDPNITGSYSNADDCGWEIDNGLIRTWANGNYRYLVYMFETDDNIYSDRCSSSDYNSVDDCDADDTEWRVLSSSLNKVYYDPDIAYSPWAANCGNSACSNASFSSARSNPIPNTNGYNKTRNLQNWSYNVWIDDKGFTGDRPYRSGSVNSTNTPNGIVDLWDSYVAVKLKSDRAEIRTTTFNPNSSGMNPTTTLVATLTTPNVCYNALGDSSLVREIFNGSLDPQSTDAEGCKTISQAQTNYANWYQYERRRAAVAKSAISKVVDQFPTYRYGLALINEDDPFITMPDASSTNFSSHNANLLDELNSYRWLANGTPLRKGLQTAGKYYDGNLSGKSSPITAACQQNFTLLVTDGYWNGSNPSNVDDSDNDGISRTLADVADYYYKKDLSNFNNTVKGNNFDNANHQHMVTYTVAFGVTGELIDTDGDGWPDTYADGTNFNLAENSYWGNPYNSDTAKIDDMWHAAFNSKGKYLNAGNSKELNEQFENVFNDITDRVTSATSVSKNSGTITTESKIYQAKFDTANWSGTILSYGVNPNATISITPDWSAACMLDGGTCQSPTGTNTAINYNDRVIITPNWEANGQKAIPFRFPNNYASLKVSGQLPANIDALLSDAPYSANTYNWFKIAANQAYGEALVNYLRGDKTFYASNNGYFKFRNRNSVLGDIVNSGTSYVGPPNRYYSDTFESQSYSSFKSTYANRTPMLVSGANDGMLHIFNASNGKEILAFVPGETKLYENLHKLADESYTHQYYVDGAIAVNDVYINNAWRTVVVGGLGKGGQGIYALDITNPNNFSENNASNIFMWEFTDEDDADLGYTFSNIHIVKVKAGNGTKRWAAVFSSGYNSTENDSTGVGNGKAYLFIVFLDGGANGTWTHGTDYIKIPVSGTAQNPNGLASPFPIDINNDLIVDYVYAGDLNGDMWRFNLTSDDLSTWPNSAFKIFSAYYNTPGSQPITSQPVVGAHPTGLDNGVMVYFGTGKYLETSDDSQDNQKTQAFYGIWDKLSSTVVAKNSLLEQQILAEITQGYDTNNDGTNDISSDVRYVSNNGINWDASLGDQHLGWYLNLQAVNQGNKGERVIYLPQLRNGRIIFTTLIPSENECDFGGDSWLMELDATNGGGLYETPFDLNKDGKFSTEDFIEVGDIDNDGESDFKAAGGKKSDVGIIAEPTIMLNEDKESEVKITSGTQGLSGVLENPGTDNIGRQNWRQLR